MNTRLYSPLERRVRAKWEFFVDAHLWPLELQFNPDAWLNNFLESEREYALCLLNAFHYFSAILTSQLFKNAFERLAQQICKERTSLIAANTQWDAFKSSLIVTHVTGEQPRSTDSGYLFSRRARQILGLADTQIMEPVDALRFLLHAPNTPILFVDDFIGSGSQMMETWNRYYDVDINGQTHQLQFSALLQGRYGQAFCCPILCAAGGRATIALECPDVILAPAHFLDRGESILSDTSRVWPEHLRQSASKVIHEASLRAGVTTSWRGFQGQGLLIAFEHGIPDATIPTGACCIDSGGFGPSTTFFLIDEYENLLDYQQRVVNTLVKHTSGLYYFKLGVRELGWRCHSTLNDNEQLVHPADYARIPIAERLHGDGFRRFALDVCNERLKKVAEVHVGFADNVQIALPGLSDEEESLILGVDHFVAPIVNNVQRGDDKALKDGVALMHPLEIFLAAEWARVHQQDVQSILKELLQSPDERKERYGNYKYAALFAIRRGKRGIDKFYCGWDTFTLMAAGNIRYVLELVDHSFLLHIQTAGDWASSVSPETQTKAAHRVGAMNLSELEGLSVKGARLTKLVLGLGRVLQQMAADPFGHTAEVNQFHLTDVSDEAEELLRAAVMHLALMRFPATKLGDESDPKEYDYSIHAERLTLC